MFASDSSATLAWLPSSDVHSHLQQVRRGSRLLLFSPFGLIDLRRPPRHHRHPRLRCWNCRSPSLEQGRVLSANALYTPPARAVSTHSKYPSRESRSRSRSESLFLLGLTTSGHSISNLLCQSEAGRERKGTCGGERSERARKGKERERVRALAVPC